MPLELLPNDPDIDQDAVAALASDAARRAAADAAQLTAPSPEN